MPQERSKWWSNDLPYHREEYYWKQELELTNNWKLIVSYSSSNQSSFSRNSINLIFSSSTAGNMTMGEYNWCKVGGVRIDIWKYWNNNHERCLVFFVLSIPLRAFWFLFFFCTFDTSSARAASSCRMASTAVSAFFIRLVFSLVVMCLVRTWASSRASRGG